MAVHSILEGGKNRIGPRAPIVITNHSSHHGEGSGYDSITVLNNTANITPKTTTVLVASEPIQCPCTRSKRRVQVGHRSAISNQRLKI